MSRIVVAVGGNAILCPDEKGTADEQLKNLRKTAKSIADMIEMGHEIILTHGNGPQVGNILIRNELGASEVPPMPLDVCVADSQGGIGYMMQQTLQNELRERGIDKTVVSIVTQVLVDENDDAFNNPTKFIGKSYGEDEVGEISKRRNWIVKEDKGRGYRRVVPSPKPIKIIEKDAVIKLVKHGCIVIAAGGGGVPVIETDGRYVGVEAVIDKDRASAVLAREINADGLLILMPLDYVYLNFGTEKQEKIEVMSVDDADKYMSEGHFPPGSMGPKIEAAIDFLRGGGKWVKITSLKMIRSALKNEAGTLISRDVLP